jgi:hypothetical protein
MKTKKCVICNENKTIEEMVKTKQSKDGLSCYCKSCMKIKSKEFRLNNSKQQMLSNAKSSAKKRGLEFNITIDDIVIPEFCPFLNIKLNFNVGKGLQPDTPSIDRIDNSFGYIKGNIQIISNKANTLKNNLSNEELLIFANNVIKFIHSK